MMNHASLRHPPQRARRTRWWPKAPRQPTRPKQGRRIDLSRWNFERAVPLPVGKFPEFVAQGFQWDFFRWRYTVGKEHGFLKCHTSINKELICHGGSKSISSISVLRGWALHQSLCYKFLLSCLAAWDVLFHCDESGVCLEICWCMFPTFLQRLVVFVPQVSLAHNIRLLNHPGWKLITLIFAPQCLASPLL